MPVNGAMIILPSADGNMYGRYPDGDSPIGPGNQVIFKQTFAGIANSTPADTEIFDFQYGTWIINGEKLRGSGSSPASPTVYSWLIGRDCDTNNGYISLVINPNSGSGDEAGIMFRGIDAVNFCDCINLNGTIRVLSITNGGAGVMDSGGYVIPGYSNTQDYLLELYAWGNRIFVYLDGLLIHDITNSTHITGTIWGIKSSNGIYQTFDDIMLPDFYVDQETSISVCGFWHSMISHTNGTPPNAPASTWTEAGNWMTNFDSNSGVTATFPYALFGNAEGINSRWVADNVDDAFTTYTFSHYTAMAPNFVQNWANAPFPNQSPAEWAAHFDELYQRVLDAGQEPEMMIVEAVGYSRHVIGAYPVDDTNLTDEEFDRWRQFNQTTQVDWYVDFIDEFIALRPDAKFRIVPVAQIFCDLMETPYVTGTHWSDYFGDPAPHGTPTYYLLTAIIMHRAMFGTDADFTGYTWPVGHGANATVVANINTISAWIGGRMDYYESDPTSPFRFKVY